MKIAYIILAHKCPNQLVRLVNKLKTDTTTFFIHIDKKTDSETYQKMVSPLVDCQNIHFLERLPRYYGDFNHLNATLNAIRQILRSGMYFDYVILLTGQDYPIRSNRQIEKTLQEGIGRSYMEYFKLPSEHWQDENGGYDRINYWHLHWRGLETPLFKRNRFFGIIPENIWSALVKILHLPSKLPLDCTFYGGSAYWCLSGECIAYIGDFIQKNEDFVQFFRHVKIPEEIFFQTVLMNSPFKNKIENDNFEYIIWTSTSRHPKLLDKDDFADCIASNKLFARKFDCSVDEEVLDMLDEATG